MYPESRSARFANHVGAGAVERGYSAKAVAECYPDQKAPTPPSTIADTLHRVLALAEGCETRVFELDGALAPILRGEAESTDRPAKDIHGGPMMLAQLEALADSLLRIDQRLARMVNRIAL